MKASYPLYANLEKALENSLSDLPTHNREFECRDAAGCAGRIGSALP
ncbi:mce-like protein [Escherichia coli]|uniref:Mce-like protein n=1 Tax=Escherichia coli TaxID=562 RepID=A0A2X1K7M1_ECOLX|nr:mce-like protein [Escherichia coli]